MRGLGCAGRLTRKAVPAYAGMMFLKRSGGLGLIKEKEEGMDEAVLQGVKFGTDGLVCAVAQDWQSGRVLMVAWMNAEALAQTAATGYAHYYSRSRQKQWMKGESSGHTQKVHELRLDCDGDAVVMKIEQNGGIACHTGRESCFYKVWRDGVWQTADAVIKDEAEIYGGADRR